MSWITWPPDTWVSAKPPTKRSTLSRFLIDAKLENVMTVLTTQTTLTTALTLIKVVCQPLPKEGLVVF